jgi:hypothetical protein
VSRQTQLMDQFRVFCERAIPALQQSRPEPPIDAFQTFVRSATPILLNAIENRLDVIRDALRCLEPWLLDEKYDLGRSSHFQRR